ncbi:MAG: endonuclease MutS2 [Chloroflexi bacterium]|nr:MAG: endonuclease MutS2 [Chloroflexota bacterium]
MISEKTSQTLELLKILDQVAGYTSFSAGKELVLDLIPTSDLEEARTWQKETTEVRRMFEEQVNISLGGVRDVREPAMQATRGIMIDASVLLDIRQTLRRATTLRRTIGRMRGQYPLMAEIINEAEECPHVQDEIGRAIDDKGEVKDSASPKLAIIRRDIKTAHDRLQGKLNRIINGPKAQFLQEPIITMRSGRYVIPLKADHKGKIKGVVHDSSSSGATLFIEPLETVELNNAWRELQLDEEKEVRRVLLALTDLVGEESERIVRTVEILAYVDLVLAKAQYADALNAVEPVLLDFKARGDNPNHPGSIIQLQAARHPLLRGHVVPIDVELDPDTYALVITGPNTGGKTVSLKTIGLLALMAQCGLHLPADEAKLTVFAGIYADIGDEQSIEQSLSTFSSHISNTIHILREANERSLVLLDELGAGTDPAEGSALARAILNYLVKYRVTTIVTTHHPELKNYSVETPGVRNASVEFDAETLAPTYRLIIGLPGRSQALAIATRLGLPEDIINDARSMVATDDLVADDLLDEIQRTREDIRRQQAEITAIREDLERERDELQARLDKIEDERRDIVNAARRHAENEIKAFQKEIRRLRNDMRSAGLPLETIRAIQEVAEKLAERAGEPVERQVEQVGEDIDWIPKLGDNVWLDTLNAEGTIVELDDSEAMVQVGTLRVRAGLHEMRRRNRSERRKMKRGHVREYDGSPEPNYERAESPGLELDLRGKRVDEALRVLDVYVDTAYRAGLPFARIIHGKGTGALREAVQNFVREHPLVSKVTRALPKEGGDGVTIIHMVPL